MKKQTKLCIAAIICIAIVLFFPVSRTQSFSGTTVPTGEGEAAGPCVVTVEVRELRSLVLRYRTHFSFTLDGTHRYSSEEAGFPIAASVSKNGDRMLSQMYYDENANRMKLCSLFYRKDLSSAHIFWNDTDYELSLPA